MKFELVYFFLFYKIYYNKRNMQTLKIKLKNEKVKKKDRIENIPAILYGPDITNNIQIYIEIKSFEKYLSEVKKNCYTTVIQLIDEKNKNNYLVIIKDIAWHKLTMKPIHIDFYSIKTLNEILIKYNLFYKNEDLCIGVKNGGKLKINHSKYSFFVNPHKMISEIEIDLQNLNLGEEITSKKIEEKYSFMNLKTKTHENKNIIFVSVKNKTILNKVVTVNNK